MKKPLFVAALAALLGWVAEAPAAAPQPVSVGALFNRIPELPATAEEAATWVDKSGQLVHPGLLALNADIQAHQRFIEQIQRELGERHMAQSNVVMENMNKGMADAGIDMARMQSDPAYAQQVQERMRKMSPQELMALSQKMNQPLNQDKRYQNQAKAMADDPPAVRAAAETGEAYAQAQLARMNAQQALWRDADAAVAKVLKTPLKAAAPKPAMAWDNIGCDAGCRAQWDTYASQMLPLMVARDTEVLRIRRAAVQRQRASVADGLKTADQHLLATQYGALSQSQVNQGRLVTYDGAALGELQALITRITDSARSAAVVVHCGKQVVLVPGAVCR
ncbi:hypothetical protein ACVNIS_20400 [Sphaerotilaceae bacterium SBD11-9]